MDNRKGLVPYASIDTTLLPDAQRMPAWQEFVSAWHAATPLKSSRLLESQSHSWVLGDLVVGWAKFHAQTMVRRLGKQIVDGERRYLFCVEYLHGSTHYIHDGDALDIHPGTVYILDYERESHSVATDACVQSAVIPYEAVGYDPTHHPARFAFDVGTAAGRVISEAMHSMILQAPTLELTEAPKVAAFFIGAISRLLEASVDEVSGRPLSRGYAIRSFIADNAHRPMTVAFLSERFGLSRATLYRHFKAYGGLKAFVEIQRMDNALRLLTIGPHHRGRVAHVAEATGYSSVRQFSKAFVRRFGFKPSEVLGVFPDSVIVADGGDYANRTWQVWNSRYVTDKPTVS